MFNLFNKKSRLPPPFVSAESKPDFVHFLPGATIGEALTACDNHIRENPQSRLVYMWDNPAAKFNDKGALKNKPLNSNQWGFTLSRSGLVRAKDIYPNAHYDLSLERPYIEHRPFFNHGIALSETIVGLGTLFYKPLPLDADETIKELALKSQLDNKLNPILEEYLGDPVCAKPGQIAVILTASIGLPAALHGLPTKLYDGPSGRRFYGVTPK